MLGVPPTTTQVNQLLTQVTTDFRRAIARLRSFNNQIMTMTDAEILGLFPAVGTADQAYNQADLDKLRAISTDLNNLYLVFTGQMALATAYDFTQHIASVWGIDP